MKGRARKGEEGGKGRRRCERRGREGDDVRRGREGEYVRM